MEILHILNSQLNKNILTNHKYLLGKRSHIMFVECAILKKYIKHKNDRTV